MACGFTSKKVALSQAPFAVTFWPLWWWHGEPAVSRRIIATVTPSHLFKAKLPRTG